MNRFLCTGRLVRDPEVRYSSGEDPVAIARFTLAIERRRKGRDGEQNADFPRFIAFGKTAEICEKYLRQGNYIEAEASVQTGSYTGRDGQTVYTTEFVIERIGFLDTKVKTPGQNQKNIVPEAGEEMDGFEEKFVNLSDDKENPFR